MPLPSVDNNLKRVANAAKRRCVNDNRRKPQAQATTFIYTEGFNA